MNRSILFLLVVSACSGLVLSGCATGGTGSGENVGYEAPDPLTQQVKMQERMSQVTRTLTPF